MSLLLVYDLLNDPSTYNKLSKNPLDSQVSDFNKNVEQNFQDNDELIKKFVTISPCLPYMYGLIKTHKPNNPVRPITCSVGCATHTLSKWLVTLLNPIVVILPTAA